MPCTQFCASGCKESHHPLLVDLLRVVDSQTLKDFEIKLLNYMESGFELNSQIPDPNPSFRHPLLHWAAVLGRGDVLRMLQRAPFSVNMNCLSDEEQTALHRSLLFWSAKNTNLTLRQLFEVIEQLAECLGTSNIKKETSIHICARRLAKCGKQDLTFWKQIMNKLTTTIDDTDLEIILNAQDVDGDTVLHILSVNGELLDVIHSLLCCGANFSIKNCRQETPMDISWKYSIAVYNLYHMITSEIGLNQFYTHANVRRTRLSTGLSKTKDYTKFFTDDEDLKKTHRKQLKIKEENNSDQDNNGFLEGDCKHDDGKGEILCNDSEKCKKKVDEVSKIAGTSKQAEQTAHNLSAHSVPIQFLSELHRKKKIRKRSIRDSGEEITNENSNSRPEKMLKIENANNCPNENIPFHYEMPADYLEQEKMIKLEIEISENIECIYEMFRN